jgi:hypothetical protein
MDEAGDREVRRFEAVDNRRRPYIVRELEPASKLFVVKGAVHATGRTRYELLSGEAVDAEGEGAFRIRGTDIIVRPV